jgi:ABC-type transport system substrate-binding protein
LTNSKGSSFSFKDGVLYVSTKKSPTTDSAKGSSSPLKIKITTIQNTELTDTAKFIQNAWKKIGVQTDIEVIDRKDLSTVVKDRNFEALLFGYSIKNPKDYYSFFSSKERSYPKLNIANYTSKQVDKILDVLVNENTKERIDDLTNQLSVEISADNPIILLYKPQFVFAHFSLLQVKLPKSIKSEEDRYDFVEYWYTNTEKVFPIFNNSKIVTKIIYQLDTLLY